MTFSREDSLFPWAMTVIDARERGQRTRYFASDFRTLPGSPAFFFFPSFIFIVPLRRLT
jgi:hypothetical protein